MTVSKKQVVVSFVLVSLFCVFLMLSADKSVALWLKANVHGNTEKFFKIITELGLSGWWFAFAIIAYINRMSLAGLSRTKEAFEKYRHQARSFVFMVAALAASSVVVTVIKVVIGRYRPRYLFNDGLYGFEPFNFHFAMNSFPSGHSQTIWAAMLSLLFIFPRYNIAYILLAVLVSASRAVTTVHYCSDVVMGSYLAIIITIWLRNYFETDGIPVEIKAEKGKMNEKI